MTPLPTLVDAGGRQVRLDRELASGGEGAVYTLEGDPGHLAKVYHPHKRTPDSVEKLRAILALSCPDLLRVAAWPKSPLLDARSRQPVGFLMQRLTDSQPVQQLYNPVQRLKSFPRAGWGFQVHAAANLAAAFDEVHKAGCLVGDVNQSNALVSQQAVVRLIDCDSFQVRANGRVYPCEVGVPHYTPPELQGKSFRGLVRAENHDRFGLAVFVYQLLFAGRHPYMGLHRDDAPFDQLIRDFRFAQGPAARSWGMEPPPHTPTFEDIPTEVGALFRRAFERGSEANGRPRADEWLNALKRLSGEVATCSADPGHTYWRGAKGCVWCRLAQRGGPEYYFGVAGGAGSFAVDEARIQEVLRRLSAAQTVEHPWDRSRYAPASRPVGHPLPTEIARLRAEWKVAEDGLQVRTRERQSAEAREVRLAESQEVRRVEELEGQYREVAEELAEELRSEQDVLEAASRDRGILLAVLAGVTALGVVILPLGFVHRAFAVIGFITACVFGLWLAIYNAMSPAAASRRRLARLRREQAHARWEADERIRAVRRDTKLAAQAARQLTDETLRQQRQTVREREAAYRRQVEAEAALRRRRLDEAEAAVQSLERAWTDRGRRYRRDHEKLSSAVHASASECRSLAVQYQAELTRLTANAEAAARLRHLRLRLIAEAEIPKIGDGRKQTLASHNIFTAADVEESAIRGIKGFGDALTSSLLAWRDSVAREFRFDPKAGVPPADHSALVVRFRSVQQRILSEATQQLAALEALAPAYHNDLQRLASELQVATGRYEQAKADWSLVS